MSTNSDMNNKINCRWSQSNRTSNMIITLGAMVEIAAKPITITLFETHYEEG